MNVREKFAELYWEARLDALGVLHAQCFDEDARIAQGAARAIVTLDGPPAPPVAPPETTESRLEAALRALLGAL